MRRLVSFAILLFFTVPFGMSLAGCSKSVSVHYCNGGDSGPSAGQIAEITLAPNLATYGESLNYGQIGQGLSASAVDCFGSAVSVRGYTYASTDTTRTFADINPSNGQVCAGTFNRNTGGGVPNYTTCTPPATTTSGSLAYVTATANGAVSNAIPVYVHPVATSVLIGNPTQEVTTTTGTYPITEYSVGPTGTTFYTTSQSVPAFGATVTLSGFPTTTILNGQIVTVIGDVASTGTKSQGFLVGATFSPQGTDNVEPGVATASVTQCVPTDDPSSNCCASGAALSATIPAYTGQSCVSQGHTGQLTARVYANGTTNPADNITCQVGHLTFSARTAPNVVTIDENGIATAQQPGSTTITAVISASGSGSTAGLFSTCPPASIALSSSSINVPLNNTQPLNTTVFDTNGNPITGLLLEYETTDQQIIPTSGNAITPAFPGTANITAVCQPPNCNTAPFSQINYLGNGVALTSNSLQVTTAGASATVLYVGSTESQYIYPLDFTTNQPGTLLKLPYVPNSMVIPQTGGAVYLGSSQALMTVNTATNAVTANTAVVGQVLSVSPSGGVLVVTDPVRQTVSLVLSSGTVSATYGGIGTSAAWSPDSQTVYITTTTNQLLVHTGLTGWTADTTDEIYTDVAVTVPHIGAYFAAPLTEARSYCPASTITSSTDSIPNVSSTFYPKAQTTAVANDVVSATDDGNHILGATASTTPATLNDFSVTLPVATPCPEATTGLPTSPTFTSTNRTFPLPGITAASITGVVPAENSALAFVTYTGSSTPAGQLPQYVPASGALSLVQLSGGAIAPVAGVFSSDNLSFYVGTSGDHQVHLITITYPSPTTPTATDTKVLSPNLPLYNGTGFATPNLLVQRPKKATSELFENRVLLDGATLLNLSS